MFWEKITRALSFTGVKDIIVWQDVLFGVLLIPFAIEFLRWIINLINNRRPLRLLLKEFIGSHSDVLVFLSQLSALDKSGGINYQQEYVIKFPTPLPTDKNTISFAKRGNIDPLWSEGDGECLASVYNVFGRVNKVIGLRIGDSIQDWDKWSNPTISIGFSYRTHKLIEKCDPIFFKVVENELSVKGNDLKLVSLLPNDAGIVQKTFIKNSSIPVFILAGLGTMGTSVAGHFLSKNCVELGKLYENKPFCVLLSARTDEGRDSVIMRAIYPRPTWNRIILHFPTYHKFDRNSVFPKSSSEISENDLPLVQGQTDEKKDLGTPNAPQGCTNPAAVSPQNDRDESGIGFSHLVQGQIGEKKDLEITADEPKGCTGPVAPPQKNSGESGIRVIDPEGK